MTRAARQYVRSGRLTVRLWLGAGRLTVRLWLGAGRPTARLWLDGTMFMSCSRCILGTRVAGVKNNEGTHATGWHGSYGSRIGDDARLDGLDRPQTGVGATSRRTVPMPAMTKRP